MQTQTQTLPPHSISARTKLTRIELIKIIARDFDITIPEARKLIDLLFSTISTALKDDRIVELRRFGVFRPMRRKARVGTNFRRNATICIPPEKRVRFKESKILFNYLQSSDHKAEQP